MIETGPIKTDAGPKNPNTQVTGTFPLSFSQESLWLEHQLFPGSAYNMPEAWRFKGLLDVMALRTSLNALVQRHETLRTVIRRGSGGVPEQVILDHVPFELKIVDARHLPSLAEPETMRELMRGDAQRAFDLETGPLARGTLYRLSEQDHVLLINMHHIISDAWSQAVFMRDLSLFYRIFTSPERPVLPELPIQFADFAVWQRENSSRESYVKQLAFWKAQLSGSLPPSSPPEDFQRTAVSNRPGITTFSNLSADLVRKLEDLSREHHTTLFMTLLAGFKALLHRYTGHEDIIVGCPISGRDRTETEPLIGMLVNTVAFRAEIQDTMTFAELLERVRHCSLDAYANQEAPLDQIVSELKPERLPHRHPLFQVVFGLQTEPPTLEFPGLQMERIELGNGAAKFDWTLLLTRTGNELSVRSEIDSSLYKAQTSKRLVRHYKSLLEVMAEQPSKKLSEVNWITPEEQRTTVVGWNRTRADYDREATVHSVFEEHAKHLPLKPALTFKGVDISYETLNSRANRIAGYLVEHGAKPGERIALRIKRSPDLIAAMLGILKAGGAYVPIDDSYPEARIRFMLESSGARILLSDSAGPTFAGCDTLLISDAIQHPESHRISESKADHVAYVMYTSGSTGTPKGVEVSHRAILRLVLNPNYVQIDEASTFLQFSSSSFDAATFEIWAPLLNGARLVIFPPHMPSLAELGRTIASEKIDILWLTAGLFNQMIDNEPASLKGVRQLLTGGEALSVHHIQKAVQLLPDCTIINGYGPTENTTFSCCHRVQPAMFSGHPLPSSVPIGRPISNTQAYILDSGLKPCPIGCPGELWLGGDGLANGYAGRPDLTGERFKDIEIAGIGSVRLYRTGDIARWLDDGTIEYLGRCDQQIKLRGFRIEAGEIETALQEVPGISAAVVSVVGEGANKRLVAHFVSEAGVKIAREQIVSHLEIRLPAYMIPADYVQLERLPLTPNGKIDRAALPVPETSQADHEAVQPRSEHEHVISKVWKEVLKRNGFGIHDNFFHLGGHSLLATQVASRLSQIFGTEVSVSSVFEHPTIALMAEALPKEFPREHGEKGLLTGAEERIRARALLERLDTLSDEEVEALLREQDGF